MGLAMAWTASQSLAVMVMILVGCQMSPFVSKSTGGRAASQWRQRLELHRGDQEAVANLALEMLEGDAVEALVEHLDETTDPATRDGIIGALARSGDRPPSIFARVMLEELAVLADGEPQELALRARALGRSLGPKTARQAIDFVRDWLSLPPQKVLVVSALGYFRDRHVAELLIELIGADRPAPVRAAAIGSLQILTGNDRLGDEPDLWRQWHARRRKLSDNVWTQVIVDELIVHQINNGQQREQELIRHADQANIRARSTTDQSVKLMARLVHALRQIYRLTATRDQPAKLMAWLSDGHDPVKLLALELAKERTVGDFGESLRAVVRRQLDDRNPVIRKEAATLLANLQQLVGADADAVAGRLAVGAESNVEVLNAYLLVISRLPRADAVEPALAMLENPKLRARAAAALAAAIDKRVAGGDQTRRAARSARRLSRVRLPEPELVALLAEVADDADWLAIRRWLEADDQKVKEEAAKAWAASVQPVIVLVRLANDDQVRPWAIHAAQQRGKKADTMLTLIDHPPRTTGLEQWRDALVAMAGRVPVAAIRDADAKLIGSKTPTELRTQLLTIAIERQTKDLNDGQTGQAAWRLLIDLRLARAEVRLDGNEAQSAMIDLREADEQSTHLDKLRRQRYRVALLRARLHNGEDDEVSKLAGTVLNEAGNDALDEWRGRVVDAFRNAVQRSLEAKQAVRAQTLLAMLAKALEGRSTEQFDALIVQLRQLVAALPPPAKLMPATATGNGPDS